MKEKVTSFPERRLRLFVLGDSISLHYAPHLARELGKSWECERKPGREENPDQGTGPNGGDSAAVSAYLAERLTSGGIAADWLLLNCGLHDIKSDRQTGRLQVALPDYAANLRAALETVRQLGLRPIWVRTTPVVEALHNAVPGPKDFNRFAQDVVTYNAAADRIMGAGHVPDIDLFSFTAPLLPEGTYDGVHFNEAVRARQAEFIAREVCRIAET
jgi:lysophospholipase L1-like esterase